MIKSYTKKTVVGMLLLLFAFYADAQINNPVIWNYTAKKIADKTYELHITASINANWHLYAQGAGTGPEPTTAFTFTKNPLINFDGNVKEVGKMEKYYDKNMIFLKESFLAFLASFLTKSRCHRLN